ncbi:MAG TPA: acetate--CoA ligase family protein [Gemmatimonadaceae bacterium]|nr:acetate--CoA ligase family protein [Gemmatimonadaceae bacterium]
MSEPTEGQDNTRSVEAFFHPRSVAVIGASRKLGTISGELLHNIMQYGFNGPVYPVNPVSPVVQSIVSYPTVEDVPGPVDLAVIVVPAVYVIGVAKQCARKGVRAMVVISAGFAEADAQGRERQNELVKICRDAGIGLIGPNCMGIITTDPDVHLNATFAPMPAPAGGIGFMSQSGGLGLAIMDYAGSLGLGLSTFVSVGNKADISGNDLITFWESDPRTDTILLYLESFGNPRKFSRIARRVARKKPIIAVKSGRSPAGARATSSHTGALIAASDITVDALFKHSGVIRTDTLEEMFDVAALLGSQSAPKGRRVAILTNAGGPGILCADACAAEGLEVPSFSPNTQQALRNLLPAEASIANPVDMIASASAGQYRKALELLGNDPGIDAIIVIFIPPLVTRAEDVAAAIVEGTRALKGMKPVLTVFMQSRGVPDELRGADIRIPSYSFPENAARALARVSTYGEWLVKPSSEPVFTGIQRERARDVIDHAIKRGGGWLEPDEVWTILSSYGLPVLMQRTVASAQDAETAAREFGSSVAIKGIAPGLVHKTDAGAVQLNVSPENVRNVAAMMASKIGNITGFLVQEMAKPGAEMIVGVAHDRQFGPVVACGAGGVMVELIKDVSVRLTPLSREDASAMVRELKTFPLLEGYRGSPARDIAALEDVILRIGALVDDIPSIAELDLNPVLVHENGATIVDARIRIE